MNQEQLYKELRGFLKESSIYINEPLSRYTYTKTGGNADFLLFPTSYSDIQNIINLTSKYSIPLTILGNASNLIVRDGGIRGVVLNLTRMTRISVENEFVTAQAGAAIIDASRFALENHLTGLEFACGIPGSVGGALYMNAGAYGGEVKDVLEKALVLTPDGELTWITNEEFSFGYRKSTVEAHRWIVLEAIFRLEPGTYEMIQEKMDEFTFLRESKQPLEYPSCGSVFKRPPGHFAGKLIQDSGLQGKRIGGVEVSNKHAGFMVNVDHGSATDYVNLIRFVKDTVKKTFNVPLETEVKIIGEDKKAGRNTCN